MSAPMETGTPPAKIVMQLINGKGLSRCISLAAELAIADMLIDGPQDITPPAQALIRTLSIVSSVRLLR